MSRPAHADDIDEICMSLPEVELGTSWGDRPTHKQALVEDERLPFFTIDHVKGFNAVLVQQSRLGEIEREELAEIITDAWAAKAPQSPARKYFQDG